MTAPADTTRAPSSPGCSPGPALRDAYGPLLRLDQRDRAGLLWLKTRCQQWRNALRRRRKYGLPRGEPFTPEEGQLIEALADLENAVSSLLLAEPSSLCPVSETRLEHTRQRDAGISRPQSSHKTEVSIDQIGKS